MPVKTLLRTSISSLWKLWAGIFWCYAFLFGMIASELGLFDLLHERFARFKSIYTWGVCSVLVLTTGLMRYISPSWGDFPFAVAILIFSFLCVSRLHFVSTILKFIGKHSANIFFFHSFLYLYNFQPFVYTPKYAPLILTIFIIECLAVSVVIEFIKKISGIQKGIGLVRKVMERQF